VTVKKTSSAAFAYDGHTSPSYFVEEGFLRHVNKYTFDENQYLFLYYVFKTVIAENLSHKEMCLKKEGRSTFTAFLTSSGYSPASYCQKLEGLDLGFFLQIQIQSDGI
jgi:hypothetical protein